MEEINSTDLFPFDMGNSTNIEELYPKHDALYIVIPMTVIYVIIFITGLVGNVSTCIVIARNKSMHTATNYYLFSLAISDLLLLVSGLPPEIYMIWSRYPYVFGYTFCVLRGLFAETSANATVLTITAFTIERYVAICHPFLSHTMSKLSRVIKLILFIWVMSIIFAIPQAAQFELVPIFAQNPDGDVICDITKPIFPYSFEVSTLFFFILPMTLISVLYAMIGFRLRSSSMMKRAATMQSVADSTGTTTTTAANSANGGNNAGGSVRSKHNCRHQQSQSSRRVLKMLVAVVVAFFICWAPFHTQRLLYMYANHDSMSETYRILFYAVTYISGILYFLSTTINPFLYNIMSNKFREAFKETFSRCCGLARLKSGWPQRTYSVLSRSAQRGGHESSESYKDDHSLHTNTTLTTNYKYSIDSIPLQATGKRKSIGLKKDSISITPNWPVDRSEVCVTMVSKSNLDRISPHTRLVSVQLARRPRSPSRMMRVWRLLNCSHRRAPDSGGSFSSIYSTPARDPHDAPETMDDNDSGMVDTKHRCDISNSSLKDVEMAVLVDELSTYMQEIKNREVSA